MNVWYVKYYDEFITLVLNLTEINISKYDC